MTGAAMNGSVPAPSDPGTYDPSVAPARARETASQIAREHPENLPWYLYHMVGIEAAERRTAETRPRRRHLVRHHHRVPHPRRHLPHPRKLLP